MAATLDHRAAIAAWLRAQAPGRTAGALLEHLDATLASLCSAAAHTLSEPTLSSILERVVARARERSPHFEALECTGPALSSARLRAGGLEPDGAAELAEFVLVEFLTVVGQLTGEILSPRLHAALARSAAGRSAEG